jgi:hypothetical protein
VAQRGELIIKRGLKRRARKRKLVIDHEMKEVLERLLKESQCDDVFTSPQDPTKPPRPESTDPFTLQYVAGHDNIKTAMRYVHPRDAALHKLFARLADLQRPEDPIARTQAVQNPVQS